MNQQFYTEFNDISHCQFRTEQAAYTPIDIENKPGLKAIAYRVGTHEQFKKTMLKSLYKYPTLRNLATSNDNDFSIALIDAWATVADILTFYQERIANESYLHTATERFSSLQLASLIGYNPGAGIAASTYLAFNVEPTEDTIGIVKIENGTKVQSIPGPGEQAQIFETIESIDARAEWNQLEPKKTELSYSQDENVVYIKGVSTNLKQGDVLLFIWELNEKENSYSEYNISKIKQLINDNKNDYTIITLDSPLMKANVPTIYALRQQASLFGHNAPQWAAMIPVFRSSYCKLTDSSNCKNDDREWPKFSISGICNAHNCNENVIFLDASYPKILADSWIVFSTLDENESDNVNTGLYKVESTSENSCAMFSLTSKVTRLILNLDGNDLEAFNDKIRETTVFAQSEKLEIAEKPLLTPVKGEQITLDKPVYSLEKSHLLLITGRVKRTEEANGQESTGENDDFVSEIAEVYEVSNDFMTITFKKELQNIYDRDTVLIHANIASATHGESVHEVLGSGDASKKYQSFDLKHFPLTYTSASSGKIKSSLEVRVNDILWHEVSFLYGHKEDDHVYVTRIDENDRTTVQFGDGVNGALLPTGQENISASYRKGSGSSGMVRSNQLKLLLTRSLGVKDVNNPIAASGAMNSDSHADIRQKAPVELLSLDRIVSLKDYEDFVRTYPGIAKSSASWTWDGSRRNVFVTVAGMNGEEVNSTLCNKIIASMKNAGDPSVPLIVKSYKPVFFKLKAAIKVDSNFLQEKVLAEVKEKLGIYFSFEARSFGQPVTLGKVMAVIQQVHGVVAVRVDELYKKTENTEFYGKVIQTMPEVLAVKSDELYLINEENNKLKKEILNASLPKKGTHGELIPAELLILDVDSLKLEVM